jgi:hypothetical protein
MDSNKLQRDHHESQTENSKSVTCIDKVCVKIMDVSNGNFGCSIVSERHYYDSLDKCALMKSERIQQMMPHRKTDFVQYIKEMRRRMFLTLKYRTRKAESKLKHRAKRFIK